MAHVIACVALKGGVGKTTVALNLATALHAAGTRVVAVDTDPQASLRTWATTAADAGHDVPLVVGLEGARLRRDLARVSEGYDVCVVDAPPQLGAESRAAMVSADLVVIPTTPGATDVWSLRNTLSVLDEAKGLRPDLRARVLLNRAEKTALSAMTKAALSQAGVESLEASLGSRVAFGEATLAGQGVVGYAPSSEASREVRRLVKEILEVLGG